MRDRRDKWVDQYSLQIPLVNVGTAFVESGYREHSLEYGILDPESNEFAHR